MRFAYASDQSLLVSLGDEIGAEIGDEAHLRVRRLLAQLTAAPLPAVRNLHPAYCSVLIVFDPLRTTHADLEAAVRARCEHSETVTLPPPRTIEIPVVYDGPDLASLAASHGLPAADVIALHSAAIYTVYFLGFVPGFAYLGGLPPQLATPRLPTPRKRVEPGSVGIAGRQTGVYPTATPGGWQLIGRTALELFNPARDPMSLLALGDQVRFLPL